MRVICSSWPGKKTTRNPEAVENDLAAAESLVADLEFRRMFNNPADPNNCFIDIQAAPEAPKPATGLDAVAPVSEVLRRKDQDRTAGTDRRRHGRHSQRLDQVEGDYAYGFLRTETGVHRLVRKSRSILGRPPHDFASLYVYPEIDDSIEIEINPADLRTDTFRASGAGGRTSTRRLCDPHHPCPTGIVVQCQSDRSQHRNRAEAMTMLKSRLYELECASARPRPTSSKPARRCRLGHQIRAMCSTIPHQGFAYQR